MECPFKKYTKEIPSHYVSKGGIEYPYGEYQNWGDGKTNHNRKDLPKNGYPYTIKYEITYSWRICRECNCEK